MCIIDEEDTKNLPYEWLGDNIKTIEDLIRIGSSFKNKEVKKKRYNLNLRKLYKLFKSLK